MDFKNKLFMGKDLIICGADQNRFDACTNHKRYADNQSAEYKFTIQKNISNPFFIKPYCIYKALLEGYNNVLCVDDDAFFIDLNWDFREIFKKYKENLIVTQGRSKKSGTTLFNAGVMFIRNTKCMQDMFLNIPSISEKTLKKYWNTNWGPLEGNEQPRIIYYTQNYFPKRVKILPYPGFNAHEITFKQRKNFLQTKPPIVHITGTNKQGKIERFTQTTGIPLP